MVKERREKELPKGKPRGRVKRSSNTHSRRNIPEREQQMQETLRQSGEKYRTLAEQSLMGLVVIQDFHIVFANAAFAEISGYSIDELLSLSPEKVQAMVHPEDHALVWGRLRNRLAGKAMPPHYEYRGIRKDGTVRWLEMHATRIEYGGRYAIQGAIIDVTARKQAEEELKHKEEHFEALIENSSDVITVIDSLGTVQYQSPNYKAIWGRAPSGEIGKDMFKDVHPDDVALVSEKFDYLLKNHGSIVNVEVRAQHTDGSWRTIEVVGRNLLDNPAVCGIVVDFRDITKRKQAEESLRISEQNFRDSIEKSPLGIRIVSADGEALYVNKTLLDICGYASLEELEAVPRNRFYTPESYAEHRERVNKRKRGEYVPSNFEISIVRKDGQVRWLSVSRGEVLWDGERQFQVVYKDITERKQAEEALRESDERYRALFDRSLDCVYTHDLAGNFLDANDTALKLLGYKREDIPPLNFASLLSQDQTLEAFTALQELKDTGAQKRVHEFRLRCKDGSFVDVEAIAAIIYHEGKPYAIQGIARDITARKRAEEALRQSEEKYRTILEEMGDGYFETDLTGNITFVNDAMIRRLGYSREELIRMNYRALRPKEAAKAVFEAYNRMYKTGESLRDFFTEIICKDGSHIFAETSAFPIRNDKGEIIGFRGVRRDITERKQAEEALRRSEERYRTILEEMEEGYYEVNLAGTFTFVNDAMSRILGYSRDELIGMNYKAYTPEENIKPIFKAYNRVYQTGEPLKWHPMPEFRKDGTLILAEDSVFPLQNEKGEVIGFRGISRNVTERKKAEEALRQSEERYRVILEEMQDSYFEVDLGGHLAFINSAGCRHLGYSKEELIGKRMSYKNFTAEEYIKPIFQIFNAVYRLGVPNKGFHWKIIRNDGSPGFIDASVAPLRNAKGEIIGFSGVGRDVTERMKIDEQLILTDRLASVGQLAAGIAHELNNPLTGVIGFSDLLLERDLPADVKGDLETVNQEAKRAVNIVKGLLAFAREQRTEKSLVDINIIIQGILQMRSYEQRVSNIEVDARLAPALPQVTGNGAQLQQVFINIIVNAEQAMIEAHGRGKLTIVTEQVGDMVWASVTDDGPGISPHNMKRLFTPFFTTREVGKGTGLGLSICHGIVTEHGGKIYAQSELSKGSTFVIELPITN